MTAAALLAECRERGITLSVSGGQLQYRAPKATLTQDLRAALIANKADLLIELARRKAVDAVLAAFPGATIFAENAPVTSPGRRQRPLPAVEVWAVGDPCSLCGGTDYWLPPVNGHFLCATCHPEPPRRRRKVVGVEDQRPGQLRLYPSDPNAPGAPRFEGERGLTDERSPRDERKIT